MRIGLLSGWFPPKTPLADAARRTHDLGADTLVLEMPGPVPPGERAALEAAGLAAGGILVGGGVGAAAEGERASLFASSLDGALAVASRLRAERVVVEGGGLGERRTRRLHEDEAALAAAVRRKEAPDPAALRALRAEGNVAAAERAARALHAAVRAGAPMAVRNGAVASDLLGAEETGWLLDDLPALSLWFDPARARRAAWLGWGPDPLDWAERLARRTSAVVVHGLGSDLAGRSHPEDGGADWPALAEVLPARVPWVLDLAPFLSAADVEDAIRYVRAQRGR